MKKIETKVYLCLLIFFSHSTEGIVPLYSVLVRPHLEALRAVLGLTLEEDVKALGCIWKRAAELVEGLEGLPCKELLRNLDLSSLSRKRGG